MTVKIKLDKKVINIRNKTLIQKLIEMFSNPIIGVTPDNSITEEMSFNKPANPEKPDDKTVLNNILQERGSRKDVSYSENTLSIFRFLNAGREIIESPDKKSMTENPVNQEISKNSTKDTPYMFAHNRSQAKSINSLNTLSSFDNLIDSMDKRIISFSESAGNSFKKMWDGLISNGRKAKDPWDAVWLSLSKSAIKQLGEILNNELFSGLFRQIAGGGSSKSFLGSIISGIAGFFSGGGLFAKTVPGEYTTGGNSVINTINNYSPSYYSNRELLNTFSKYAEAAEKWQKELRVVNDLFENNRGIKTVQEYLSKIKS